MSIQSTSINPFFAQQPVAVNAGLASTTTFDGQGNDFLSPKNILNNVHDFSSGLSPVTSNNNFVLIDDDFGRNANAKTVLRGTNSTLNDIFSPTFGANLIPTALQVSPASVQTTSVPGLSTSGTLVNTNSVLLGQVTQTPSASLLRDLSNFNPLVWQNPNSTNVLLGSMDVQNKIFGGNGLFPPVFNQYPLYPFIAPPATPYSGYTIPIPNNNGLTTLQQASTFPTTFLTNSPLFNTQITPYAISTTQTIVPYQVQVRLMSLLQALGSGNLNQLVPPNGVPPWIG
jgi:hypothetical protein